MALKVTKPRPLFTLEDDGLFQRLEFSDSEDLGYSSHKFPSPLTRESSPVRRKCNRSSLSPSDDERLDSSTDSAMGDLNFSAKRPLFRKKLTKSCLKSSLDTTPPYRKVRALRLFGSPQSPKTLLKQSEISIDSKSRSEKNASTPIVNSFDRNHSVNRFRRSRIFSPYLETNINPFTQNPAVLISTQIKRRRDSGIGRSVLIICCLVLL